MLKALSSRLTYANVMATHWGLKAVLVIALVAVGLGIGAGAAGAEGAYNRFSCVPSRGHPFPVVLVHGAGLAGVRDMAAISWGYEGPALARAGYCVFALNYGLYRGTLGRAPVARDAAELSSYIAHVRRSTHAREVSIVSHSAGGPVSRYYLRFLGGARVVRDLVSLAPPNHITRLKHDCPVLCTQLNGSALYRMLNRGRELEGGVDYTVIESRFDDAIVPYTAAFLHGPKDHLTNVLLQRRCPTNRANHAGLLFDHVALQWVKNALSRRGPADSHYTPRC